MFGAVPWSEKKGENWKSFLMWKAQESFLVKELKKAFWCEKLKKTLAGKAQKSLFATKLTGVIEKILWDSNKVATVNGIKFRFEYFKFSTFSISSRHFFWTSVCKSIDISAKSIVVEVVVAPAMKMSKITITSCLIVKVELKFSSFSFISLMNA